MICCFDFKSKMEQIADNVDVEAITDSLDARMGVNTPPVSGSKKNPMTVKILLKWLSTKDSVKLLPWLGFHMYSHRLTDWRMVTRGLPWLKNYTVGGFKIVIGLNRAMMKIETTGVIATISTHCVLYRKFDLC